MVMELHHIFWLDQFSRWQKYTSMYHLPSARKTAQERATRQNKRYKITDEKGCLVDLLYP